MVSPFQGLLVLSSLASLAFAAGGDDWLTDFEAAKALAKKEKKDLLIAFTGSDWSSRCIKLRMEVFDTDKFKSEAEKHFVLVQLEYLRLNALAPDLVAQNTALESQYAILDFPTVYAADAEGRPYAKTGYKAGGPEKYLAHLAEIRKARARRDAAFASAEKEKGVTKARHLHEALAALDISDGARALYASTLEVIVNLDADGKAGLKAKYALAVEARAVKASAAKLAMLGEVSEAAAEIGRFLDAKKPIGVLGAELHLMHAKMLLQVNDFAAGRRALNKAAEELDPDMRSNQKIGWLMEEAAKKEIECVVRKAREERRKKVEDAGGKEETASKPPATRR